MAYNTLSKVLPENKNYTENPLIMPNNLSGSFTVLKFINIGNLSLKLNLD